MTKRVIKTYKLLHYMTSMHTMCVENIYKQISILNKHTKTSDNS